MKSNRLLLIAGFALIAVVAGGVLVAILSHEEYIKTPELNISELPADQSGPKKASNTPPLDGEQKLRHSLQQSMDEKGRVGVLDEFRSHPDASSTNRVLRSAMIADSSPKVRVKAFAVAKELALGEDREAVIAILREGVSNPYSEVRREGLRACRDHPHYELMDDLMEVVRQGGRDRSVAIEALAFLDDPEAHRAVLETAQSESISREERIQAIALLSKTELDEAVQYLQTLATGEDAQLKGFAMAALAIWQERNKR